MPMKRNRLPAPATAVLAAVCAAILLVAATNKLAAQVTPTPTMLDPALGVRPAATGLNQPTTLAFVGHDDMLVLEKATGRVQRVVRGVIRGPVLDLAVNSGSERGLLGIVLHPRFKRNGFVYLFWTESSTGTDTTVLSETPLLGNRVDRYRWNGSSLRFDRNIIKLRALQPPFAEEPTPAAGRGNHDGGVLAMSGGDDDDSDRDDYDDDGRDSRAKLFIVIGDVGRRGWMQNITEGVSTSCGRAVCDDNFGGPEPDDAHLTGVVLRLNDDGSTPRDNPFFKVGAEMEGEVGANIQKVFAYGLRNTFGMAFDPKSGELWLEQNADNAFTELSRVEPGMNGGWVQVMGLVERIAEYKATETTPPFVGLQQARWPPTNIADTPQEARQRLFMLPGAHYTNPELSWRFEVAPAGIGFMTGRGLGSEFEGDLFMGGARDLLVGGHLFRFKLTPNRRHIAVSDPRLNDLVADNTAPFDITESESLLIGRDFGVGTDIETGPNGNLFVVSLSHGAVYEIFRIRQKRNNND
jgi:glucose/arabinose dehydrogenase